MELEQSPRQIALWQERRSDTIHRSLDDLLAMAHRYRHEGCLWQAMEMYWMLSEDHYGTAQAMEAEGSLLELADAYKHEGARHAARAVYERLSNLDGIMRRHEVETVRQA
ncbi:MULTISPECIES: hypothetical protein [unclassified Bradyrhizobium]|uniref:hypothetical protein n=1 Tax=unclassified Bradyrhizobium TaxID=2631580 RepID=UPI0028EAECD5|nr:MULTISPECIES: hypothetical protein [unclassified Bradyrhizobium]